MFQFPGLPPRCLWIQQQVSRYHPGGVAPFGHPRITACRQLPAAYRSHPRPSSALGAKASTVRPYSLGIPIARASESAGSCSIRSSDPLGSRRFSIAFDSSSLLCSCPGTAQAHRLSSGAPTLGSVQPTTTGQPCHPRRGRQKCGPPWTPRSNRRGPSTRWTCLLTCCCCSV